MVAMLDMLDMLDIDGSEGEGGGQVLRTSLALSVVTRTPIRVRNIRARRPKPGLMRQHLTAVKAAAAVGAAEVHGDDVGSTELTFSPQGCVPGTHVFSIGSAGSTTLVLQAVLPALMTAPGPSTVRIEGGTHNPLAPPHDYLANVLFPLLARMGVGLHTHLHRHGFFPAGGGAFTVEVQPVKALAPLELMERGETLEEGAAILGCGLPRHVMQRERDVILEQTGWPQRAVRAAAVDAEGVGNAVMLTTRSTHVTETFTAFGERQVTAERVAHLALEERAVYLASGAAVGEHLADQLMLPLAMAGGGGFTTSALSSHARTQMALIPRFLPVVFEAKPLGRCTRVWVRAA